MPTMMETMIQQLGEGQATRIGRQLGLDEGQTQAAMRVAVPAIMAAMAKNAGSKEGARSLNDALDRDHDGALLERVDQHLEAGDTTEGEKILGHVFGGQRKQVEELAARESGVQPDAMKRMMGMLAPVVMAQLGRERRQGGLDAGDLADLIGAAGGAGQAGAQQRGAPQAGGGGLLGGLAGQILGGALGGRAGAPSSGGGGMSGAAAQVLSRLGQPHFERIGAKLGLSPTQTQSMVQLALPILIAALARNASRKDGARDLHRALAKDHDGSLLSRTSDFVEQADPTPGNAILEHVFGSQRDAVERGIAKQTGVDAQTVGRVFALTAPLLLAALGQRRQEQQQSPEELARDLQREQEQLGPSASEQGETGSATAADLLAALIDQDGDGDMSDDAARIGKGLLGRLFGGGGR